MIYFVNIIVFTFLSMSAQAMNDLKRKSAEDLVAIGNFIVDEVHRFIRFSSNQDSDNTSYFRKNLWLTISRANDPKDNKGLRKRIRDAVQLDFHTDDTLFEEPPLKRQKIFHLPEFGEMTYDDMGDFFVGQHYRKSFHKDGTYFSDLHRHERSAKNAVKFGVGNCGEMADLALIFLLEYPKEGLLNLGLPALDGRVFVRRMSLKRPGDHGYVILKDAYDNHILVDPWINEVLLIGSQSMKNSNWYEYASHYIPLTYFESVVGSGHSRRWNEHRERHREPAKLHNWKLYQNRYDQKPTINDIFTTAFLTRIAQTGVATEEEEKTIDGIADRLVEGFDDELWALITEIDN